jgi:hypothetical protein
MNPPRLARYAAIAALSLVAIGGLGVAFGGGRGAASGDYGTAISDTAPGYLDTDETLLAVDKALGRSTTAQSQNQPLVPRPANEVAPKPSTGGSSGVLGSAPPAPPTSAPVTDVSSTASDRKIVQTASLKLQVKDVTGSYGDVTRIATGAGGFISTSNFSNAGESQVATVSLRVPATRYQQVLADLRALGVKVDNETSNASDVTDEYADLAARQRNLEAAETQLLTLLGQAKNVAEVLQVQDRLTSVRGQIEQAKGRQALLDKLSDLATISVGLRPVAAAGTNNVPSDGLRGVVDEAWSDSLAFLENIASGVLTVVVFSWWLPIVAVPAVVIGKRMTRRDGHAVALD